MSSLALAHKRRMLALGCAAVAIAAAAPKAYSMATAMDSPANAKKHLKLQEAALDQDLERLSAMKGAMAGRQLLKRNELLPKYQEYVARYCESGLNIPNRVLVQVMIWLFDTAQFEDALELADFAIEQGQQLPEGFKRRDIQTFVADAVVDWAYDEYNAERSPEPYLSNLLPRVDGEWDLPEQIPSKYHKLIGMRAMEAGEWETALKHLERSTELYPKAGNETRIKKCRKELAKQQVATTGPGKEEPQL